jgi:[acyl-carrier-protein] S-malonyltransferase
MGPWVGISLPAEEDAAVLAFTLPDHGSEWPGMGDSWSEHPSWELVDAASEAAGRDVAALLHSDGTERLKEIENAHLATFVLSLVALDAAERLGLAPMAVCGYGLGEYTALVASGALDFDTAVRLVVERGAAARAERARALGATVAICGLADDDVESACARAEGDAYVAGYDAPGRVIVSGSAEGVARAIEVGRPLGATVEELADSGGFHTPLLAGARDRLRKLLAEVTFRDPDPVVVANVDARRHADPADWPGLLSAQLCAPVRWRQSVEVLFADGVRTFVEFGAGTTLGTATRSSLPPRSVQTFSIASPRDLESLVDRLIATPSVRRTEVRDHDQLAGRLVVSPAAGPFQPVADLAHTAPSLAAVTTNGEAATASPTRIDVGDLVGWVGDVEVRSAFAGTLGGLLVIPGERVMPSQPVAWLDAGANA